MNREINNKETILLDDNVLTPEEAGALFHVSAWAMYKRVKKGQAIGHYVGRKLYFLKSELLASLKEQ